MFIVRLLENQIADTLKRGKSVLLLGPRQTGKTTLINRIPANMRLNLAHPQTRLRYEREPFLLTGEIEQLADNNKQETQQEIKQTRPLVIIDEIQKVPRLMDAVQDLIDRHIALFILTGSSARKLKRDHEINLLPGRVIPLYMDPLCQAELLTINVPLNRLLLDGSLPEILLEEDDEQREQLLDAYVTIYLEEEIRAEAIVRDLGDFARFLELAAAESGKIVNFNKLSQVIGKSHTTIASYYQILEDCLITERIEPIIESKTRRKLSRSQKYMFYDLGVRRVAAREGYRLPKEQMGFLFEHYIGLELLRTIRSSRSRHRLKYWRDPSGAEVDWVIQTTEEYIPIEVKWTETPTIADAKYLLTFLNEYEEAKRGYVICQTPRPVKLSDKIVALPWQHMNDVFFN